MNGRRSGGAVPPKVLVIDDQPAILRTLSTTLRLEGYSREVEPDPTAALMPLRTEPFHIVITAYSTRERAVEA